VPYSDAERTEIILGCTRFLSHHHPKPVAQRMREIAESPYGQVRQDRYGAGGFVAEFEAEIAALLGKEAAVFMPSGTMAQQIALRIWSDRAGVARVAFHPTCHLEIWEQMAYQKLHGLESILVGEKTAVVTLEELEKIDVPISTLLLELPQREIGGQLPTWEDLVATAKWARDRGIQLHMDGARLWECAPWFERSYAEICALFDTVYVSFYKILQGLPGAALCGPADVVAEARIWQRRHGGNLQQQSPAVVSAKIGLDQHLPKIAEYCVKAREFAEAFSKIDGIQIVPNPPQTNMMHLLLKGDRDALLNAAFDIAKESRILTIDHLAPTDCPDIWKFELTIGNAGLDVTADEAAAYLSRIVSAG
jgi:threonine aldolase